MRRFLLGFLLFAMPLAARADDWPQWLGPKRDGVWRETGILDKFPASGPNYIWRNKDIGGGYSGPAVASGKVYLTDRLLPPGVRNPKNPFAKDAINGQERVLCLDAKDGKILWKHAYDCKYEVSYPAGPRTTPVVDNGRVYTLGTMGDLLCLDAATGAERWVRNLAKDYEAPVQTWGFSSSPLVDGDKLICLVGGKGSLVVAFNKKTGEELWKSLTAKEQGYCPPIIIEAGGKRQLIVWVPSGLHSLDPETGKPYWSEKYNAQAGMTIGTPRQDGDNLFVSCFYNGSMLLKLAKDSPTAKQVWKSKATSDDPKNTQTLHTVISTPVLKDGYVYGVCSHGEVRCLKLDTGERIWDTFAATTEGEPRRWANVFFIAQGDRYFLPNEKGELIIAKLSPDGYQEISRAQILRPTNSMAQFGKGRPSDVVWSHPAFANQCVYMRNDEEIVCVSLAAGSK
jgi:outer membrane protein assembly factor BamB